MFPDLFAAFDRIAGARAVPHARRTIHRAAQRRAAGQLAVVGTLAALGAAMAAGIVNFGTSGWIVTLAWGAIAVLAHTLDLLRARLSGARAAVATAAILGLVWGLGLALVPGGDPASRAVLTAVLGAAMAAAGATLTAYPLAAAAFAIPAGLGSLACIVLAGASGEIAVTDAFPLFALMALVPTTIRRSREQTEAFMRAREMRDNDRIVGLLLADRGEGARDWVWGFDQDGRINRASAGLLATTFLRPEQLIGLDFVEFLSCITAPDDLLMQELRRDVAERRAFDGIELRLAGSQETCWRLSGEPILDEDGAYCGYLGVGTDVSERRRAERRMSVLAHNDQQTGLFNRAKFTETLSQAVARLERYGSPFALFYLDLDNFKLVNDSRGHMAGDKMLVEVARRIRAQVREADFAARLGGDEFALILTENVSRDGCAELARRLIERIGAPFEIEGESLSVGLSIGIAIAPLDGTRPDQLQRNADLALYRAKRDGRSVYRFFESEMDADAREKRLLEMELRDALDHGELLLHYQPLVSATDKAPTGFEALVRWRHPIRGLVGPAEFIPIAEQSTLIVEIGDWTIREACNMAANWPAGLSVAVNLSAKHFRMSDISGVVREALVTSGLEPHRLELEITEGLLLANIDDITQKLEDLRRLGVTIVMDDFGTGYSSLSYLLKFPFDKIKIDRSFVTASSSDPMARDILRAIASLGKTLHLSITAEGVETPEQAEFLSEIACHQLQGFYFARPLDDGELPGYLLATMLSAPTTVLPSAPPVPQPERPGRETGRPEGSVAAIADERATGTAA